MSYILRAIGTLPSLGMLAAGDHLLLRRDGPPQQWNFNNGQLQGIGTANGVTTCLEVRGSGNTPGTLVQLSSCTGALNQQWTMIDTPGLPSDTQFWSGLPGTTTYPLCLDSSGGPPSSGTQLVINTCSAAAASQNWIVRGMEIQLNSNAPYLCFSVDGSLTANGTQVLSYSCAEGPAELWYYEAGEIVGLGTNGTKTKCLAAAGTVAGSLVEISACTGGEKQKWLMVPGSRVGAASSASVVVITFGDRNLCVDSSGGQPVGGGTQLVLNTCTAVASQNWLVR